MVDEELLRQMQKSIDQLAEEVRILKVQLAERQDQVPVKLYTPSIDSHSFIPTACEKCPNHPSNGGSGICHCILGSQVIY